MAEPPKPFFKASRGTWYLEINRRQINLGPDEHEAWKKYFQIMADPPKAKPKFRKAPTGSVVEILDKFLTWCKDNRAQETYEWYQWRLQSFARHIGTKLRADQLKHFHIDEWLQAHPEWVSGTKHGMARSVMRACRWATKKGYLEQNPVADYEKPRAGKRKVVIPPAEFEKILSLAGCQEFKDLLVFTWETAARPQETLVAEAHHVDLDACRIVFPPDESKGEQWPRLIYLNDAAAAIVRRLSSAHPEGTLFRNSDGLPWTTDAVNNAFIRLQIRLGQEKMKKLGIDVEPIKKMDKEQRLALSPEERKAYWVARKVQVQERRKLVNSLAVKHGKKYCLYHLRHSWLDRALKRGVDALTCAILMGHRDPSTIARVYQHLSQSPDYLLNQARKATG